MSSIVEQDGKQSLVLLTYHSDRVGLSLCDGHGVMLNVENEEYRDKLHWHTRRTGDQASHESIHASRALWGANEGISIVILGPLMAWCLVRWSRFYSGRRTVPWLIGCSWWLRTMRCTSGIKMVMIFMIVGISIALSRRWVWYPHSFNTICGLRQLINTAHITSCRFTDRRILIGYYIMSNKTG